MRVCGCGVCVCVCVWRAQQQTVNLLNSIIDKTTANICECIYLLPPHIFFSIFISPLCLHPAFQHEYKYYCWTNFMTDRTLQQYHLFGNRSSGPHLSANALHIKKINCVSVSSNVQLQFVLIQRCCSSWNINLLCTTKKGEHSVCVCPASPQSTPCAKYTIPTTGIPFASYCRGRSMTTSCIIQSTGAAICTHVQKHSIESLHRFVL